MINRIRQLSLQVRLRLTYAGVVVLCWFIYPLTVGKTIALRSQVQELAALNDSIVGLPEREARVTRDMALLGAAYGRAGDTSVTREHILQAVTTACGNHMVILREFSACRRFAHENWTVETHPVIVEGEFTALLKTLHEVERRVGGTTVAVTFYNHVDKQSKKRATRAQFYIQNMISTP